MSIWGKIIGSTAGFALGGPLGAIIGGAAGHAVDNIHPKEKMPEEKAVKQIGFTISVIVLSAKMAKADGKVTKNEIIAFRNKINVPNHEIKNIGRLWDQAKQTTDGFEIYAKQIADLLETKSTVLEELLNLLLFIAKADGKISKDEIIYLKKVNHIFGFSSIDFERIHRTNIENNLNPYEILGISEEASNKEIKDKWKKLAFDHHPDRLIAKGMPIDFIKKSTSRLQEINHAWDIIQKRAKQA